jgi:CheY-like chemotaxis protein
MEACLQEHGCEVHQVSSGDEAIFSFKNGEYRFVIMDWNMQPLNGRQTLKIMDSNVHVNKSAMREKIPVLTYSVNNEDQISFPRTENLYQMAHLTKTSTLNKTFETTKKIINQINGFSAVH